MVDIVNATISLASDTTENFAAVPNMARVIVEFAIVLKIGLVQIVLAENQMPHAMPQMLWMARFAPVMVYVSAAFVNAKLLRMVDILENSVKNVL